MGQQVVVESCSPAIKEAKINKGKITHTKFKILAVGSTTPQPPSRSTYGISLKILTLFSFLHSQDFQETSPLTLNFRTRSLKFKLGRFLADAPTDVNFKILHRLIIAFTPAPLARSVTARDNASGYKNRELHDWLKRLKDCGALHDVRSKFTDEG